ncbi:hypothetical protein TNCV_2229931 [Trichonephila clavipes]|uniref:Mos1 transposase HTH domain-containing protein n=1 Tax=Trichonephila clavipes TaxID=2585209 RepID=A0A8X6WED3_TRICX|nr:hypothetical protein TNCV_2229931 [Trichonephila clavipes]
MAGLVKYRSDNFKFMLVVKVTFHTKKIILLFFVWPIQLCLQGVKNGNQQRENTVQFTVFFDKGEDASQTAEIVKGVYDVDTVTANYAQFWFRRFRSSIFDVKDAPRTVRPVIEMSIKSQK